MEPAECRIAFGSDHRGVFLRESVAKLLRIIGCRVVDLGPRSRRSFDYPEIAAAIGRRVSRGEADRGILLGATGMEMAMVANKFPGVRAALCVDELSAEIARRHLDANVLCLSSDLLGEPDIERIVLVWLSAPFDGGRHARRLGEIAAVEQEILAVHGERQPVSPHP